MIMHVEVIHTGSMSKERKKTRKSKIANDNMSEFKQSVKYNIKTN